MGQKWFCRPISHTQFTNRIRNLSQNEPLGKSSSFQVTVSSTLVFRREFRIFLYLDILRNKCKMELPQNKAMLFFLLRILPRMLREVLRNTEVTTLVKGKGETKPSFRMAGARMMVSYRNHAKWANLHTDLT